MKNYDSQDISTFHDTSKYELELQKFDNML